MRWVPRGLSSRFEHRSAGRGRCMLLWSWPAASLVLFPAGCSLPVRTFKPEQDPAKLDDLRFVHYLASVPVVTVDEGLRGVLTLTGDGSRFRTFEKRLDELTSRGAIRAAWKLKPDQILDKGTLAYMLRTICKLPRGLNEWIARVTRLGERRYALKTCIYWKIMPAAVAQEPIRGGELVAALAEAERFID